MTIPDALRIGRAKKSLTQRQAGINVGIPERTAERLWQKWEAGTQRPGAAYALRIARVLEIPIEYLIEK